MVSQGLLSTYIYPHRARYVLTQASRFVHERGTRTALYNLAFMAGVSIGPLIAGQLIQHYTWRVCSYAMAGALVINLLLVIFFMPETAYIRSTIKLDTTTQSVSYWLP